MDQPAACCAGTGCKILYRYLRTHVCRHVFTRVPLQASDLDLLALQAEVVEHALNTQIALRSDEVLRDPALALAGVKGQAELLRRMPVPESPAAGDAAAEPPALPRAMSGDRGHRRSSEGFFTLLPAFSSHRSSFGSRRSSFGTFHHPGARDSASSPPPASGRSPPPPSRIAILDVGPPSSSDPSSPSLADLVASTLRRSLPASVVVPRRSLSEVDNDTAPVAVICLSPTAPGPLPHGPPPADDPLNLLSPGPWARLSSLPLVRLQGEARGIVLVGDLDPELHDAIFSSLPDICEVVRSWPSHTPTHRRPPCSPQAAPRSIRARSARSARPLAAPGLCPPPHVRAAAGCAPPPPPRTPPQVRTPVSASELVHRVLSVHATAHHLSNGHGQGGGCGWPPLSPRFLPAGGQGQGPQPPSPLAPAFSSAAAHFTAWGAGAGGAAAAGPSGSSSRIFRATSLGGAAGGSGREQEAGVRPQAASSLPDIRGRRGSGGFAPPPSQGSSTAPSLLPAGPPTLAPLWQRRDSFFAEEGAPPGGASGGEATRGQLRSSDSGAAWTQLRLQPHPPSSFLDWAVRARRRWSHQGLLRDE